jgi:glycosyltransferase involved in cell wall biosynthesis
VILYLTYNDQPSGVYWSQVTDVVGYLNTLGKGRVRLVAMVSLHGFRATRQAIRQHAPDAIVVPMVPRMKRWRANRLILGLLCRWLRPRAIVCRGVMTTWMALRMRDKGLVKRVCFDGRGAYAAEWEEYRIIDDQALIDAFAPLEREAVHRSDFRVAVSEALVDHWRKRYGYAGTAHVVIPCTLASDVARTPAVERSDDRIKLVYAGSSAGWQSFDLLRDLLTPLLHADPRVQVLFLAKRDGPITTLEEAFPGRVSCAWLPAGKVAATLAEQDLGILLREDTVTNRVSSPTKFAEYLAAGVPVLISPHIGDFSALVRREGLGVVVEKGALPRLQATSPAEKARLQELAHRLFTKPAHKASYERLLAALHA